MKMRSRFFRVWMLLVAATAFAAPAFAGPDAKLDQRLRDATAVYHELLSSPDRGVPAGLLRGCNCIAVIPHVVKGAMVYGARHGTGVMSCRSDGGSWSPPAFISLTGGSWGLQVGGESSDLVLFFMSEHGARTLMNSSQVTLGGKASVAAGPVGRTAEASTDLKPDAEVYTYAKTRGLFAGLSVEGARLSSDQGSNRRYYRRRRTRRSSAAARRTPRGVPAPAQTFVKALP